MREMTHLLNRLGEISHDGWMHVCPIGEHPWTSADGKETVLQVIDQEACQLMARAYPLSVQDSMVDREHLSMTAAGDTAAMGWGKEAQARPDGLWVRVEWTPEGRAAVQGKAYKFNSPCFPCGGLVPLGGERFRVTQCGRIALTNNPNLSGQKPLTNSRVEPPANPHQHTPAMDFKAMLIKLLGLPEGATDDQIAAACSKEPSTVPAMNARISELTTQLTNSVLDQHGITDPGQRALFGPLLTNSATKENALKTLAQLKGVTAAPAAIHNRNGKRTPDTITQLADGKDEDEQAKTLHNRAMNYKATHKVTYEQALAAVRSEIETETK